MPKSIKPSKITTNGRPTLIRIPIQKSQAVVPRTIQRPTPIVTSRNLSALLDECPTEINTCIALQNIQLSLIFKESRTQAVQLLKHLELRLTELSLQNAIVPSLTYTTVFIESLKRINWVAMEPT